LTSDGVTLLFIIPSYPALVTPTQGRAVQIGRHRLRETSLLGSVKWFRNNE